MTKLFLDQKAPGFAIIDQREQVRTLAEYAGQWLILFFYPKDMTSGCTTEAQEFRDLYTKFTDYDCEVLGVSKDTAKTHQKFIDKESLPFDLLADIEFEMLKAYDVWKEKSMYGKKYMGIERTTFLINPDSTIAMIYEKVKPAGHAAEVLFDLKRLQEERVSA